MSVWPSIEPSNASPLLSGSEGELLSVCVDVAPRDLERLLDTLALFDFPINPRIFHDAAVVYETADGSRYEEQAAVVEFPAYRQQLEKIRDVLASAGFAGHVHAASMLDDMHNDKFRETAPPGADYRYRTLRKHPRPAAAGAH
jgi:hypothetical protein